jgi:aldehyde dehydrogenase (NAD+)
MHPDVDMVSFTGSTRAGIEVARNAALTVKRVCQELGGKAPNILLPDADFETAATKGALACFRNAGQSCSAPTRMLVPSNRLEETLTHARAAAEKLVVGDPMDPTTEIGPVANAAQFEKVQQLIHKGIEEGATLVAGGTGRPASCNVGYFVRPTVFAGVTKDMTIAREEIFGPVLSILTYESEEEAISIANDTVYGLTAYVQSANRDHARDVARRLRAGSVLINYAPVDFNGPFGGYKQSGNGREYGIFGLEEFLEVKGMVGFGLDDPH